MTVPVEEKKTDRNASSTCTRPPPAPRPPGRTTPPTGLTHGAEWACDALPPAKPACAAIRGAGPHLLLLGSVH